MARTAETIFVGDAASIVRAAQEAAAATEGAEKKIVGANSRVAKSHEAAAKAVQKGSRDIVLAGAAVVAASADMAVKSEGAAAAIAKSAGISAGAAERMVKSFRGLPELEYSGTKVAQAFATVASELGVVEGHALTTAQATKTMKAALDLTDASGGNLTQTTEALGKVMLTYSIHTDGAAKASDILFNASKRTGTSVEEVAQVVDRMRGRLGVLAPSLAETAGLMDDFARHGLKGREALTALNGVYTTLLGENKKTKAVVHELGLTLQDQAGHFVGLRKVIEQLQPSLSKYRESTQLEYTSALFGAQAAKKLLAVIHEGPAAYDAETAAVRKNATTANAAAKEHQTLGGKLKEARAAAENLGAAVGEKLIPALTAMLKAAEDAVTWLGKHKTAAEALAAVLTGVLGAALTVYAYSKAAAFVKATKEMILGIEALAVKFGLIPSAAEAARVKTIAAQAATTDFIVASDGTIVAANEAAGLSFTALAGTAIAALGKILGPLAAVTTAIFALENPQKGSLLSGGKSALQERLERDKPELFRARNEREGKVGFTAPPSNQAVNHRGRKPEVRDTAVEEAARRYGVDPHVLFGVYGTETTFGQNITTSSAGAMGAFQFIPETAKAYHYPLTNHPNAKQFKEQANAAAHYLADLIKENHGDVGAALAQYSGHTPGYAQKVSQYGSQAGPSVESLTQKAAKQRAAKAKGEGYVDPFTHASGVTRSRTDQGVDFSFSGGLGAVGKGRIVNIAQDPGGFGTEIVEELTEGPHKGQLVYYGLETGATSLTRKGARVKAGQSIARGKGTGGIELGFASSASGVPITPYAPGESHEHPTVGGEQFSKFLASIGKTGSALSTATASFEQAAAHLTLSAGQTRMVAGYAGAASSAHAEALLYGGYASQAGKSWERARSLQVARAKPLGTATGNRQATLIDTQDVLTARAEKVYYAREVKALTREVQAWQKLRASYLKFARHATGHAKKEALDKAAMFAGKIKEAQAQATELKGTIADTEAAIEGAETTLSTSLPGEIQSADLSAYQAANAKIDAEVRAGVKTEAEGKTAKEGNANRALGGGYGSLSEEGVLQVKGDLKEFAQATQEATQAQEAHTEALKEATRALTEFTQASNNIAKVEAGSLATSLADVISGQIGGKAHAQTLGVAGSGSAARY